MAGSSCSEMWGRGSGRLSAAAAAAAALAGRRYDTHHHSPTRSTNTRAAMRRLRASVLSRRGRSGLDAAGIVAAGGAATWRRPEDGVGAGAGEYTLAGSGSGAGAEYDVAG